MRHTLCLRRDTELTYIEQNELNRYNLWPLPQVRIAGLWLVMPNISATPDAVFTQAAGL